MNPDADSEFAYLQQLYNWFIVNFLARFVNSFAVNAACVKHLILIWNDSYPVQLNWSTYFER